MFPRVLLLSLAVLLGCAPLGPSAPPDGESGLESRVAALFERVRHDPAALEDFLARMPLGGDLHHHIGGSVTPAQIVRFAAEDGLCLPRNPAEVWRLTPPPCGTDQRPAGDALADVEMFAEIERRWSMKDYEAYDPSIDRLVANRHFFEIFGKIRPANQDLGRLLAAVRNQGAGQGSSYIETSSGWVPDRALRAQLYEYPFDEDLQAFRDALLADARFGRLRDQVVAELERHMARSDELLGCGTDQAQPGCDVLVRFQRIAARVQPPAPVFVQTLLAYEVANQSPLVVGVNLVAPETHQVAIRDYALHMRMFGELSQHYPDVSVTLHTAEMTPDFARRRGATSHLRLAIAPVAEGGAQADRVGHGVALAAEERRQEVLDRMAANQIAVELNLRSNELLLGVGTDQHPLPDYLAAGVPIVLATDDLGLMNTNLRHQFLLAARFPQVGYRELKEFARTSLRYGFLEDVEKERLSRRLERDLRAFEERIAQSPIEDGS